MAPKNRAEDPLVSLYARIDDPLHKQRHRRKRASPKQKSKPSRYGPLCNFTTQMRDGLLCDCVDSTIDYDDAVDRRVSTSRRRHSSTPSKRSKSRRRQNSAIRSESRKHREKSRARQNSNSAAIKKMFECGGIEILDFEVERRPVKIHRGTIKRGESGESSVDSYDD